MSQKSPLQAKKKGFTMPHTFVILLVIILFAVALTWIIPSGEYARVEDPVSGKKVVDASTFNYVENVHVNIQDIPMLIIKAFSANSDLIMLILLSGGAIHMLTASGGSFHPPADAGIRSDLHHPGCQYLYRIRADHSHAGYEPWT